MAMNYNIILFTSIVLIATICRHNLTLIIFTRILDNANHWLYHNKNITL